MPEQIELFEPSDEEIGNEGGEVLCPMCGSRIREWRKALISTAVASLCRLVAVYHGRAIHHDEFTVLLKDRNFSQLKLWGLVVPDENDDPMKRSSGRWHPTEKGIGFVMERTVIPKFVVTKHNRIIRFDGPYIGVREALGPRFDYRELIRAQEAAA